MQGRLSLADCAKSAREAMIVSRLHYTSTVKTLESQHEDFRYLFTGVSGGRYIPLLWRNRNIQANMTVRDGQDNHLPYLPSRVVDRFCEEYLLQLWKEFELSLAGAPVPSWIAEARPRSMKLTSFEYDPEDVKAARKEWTLHADDFPGNAAFVSLKKFIDRLGENYIPVVSVPESKEEYLFLHHGVDVSTSTRRGFLRAGQPEAVYSGWDVITLAVTGRISIGIPILIDAFVGPPWKQTESLHVRAMLPAGMALAGHLELAPEKLFADTNILKLTEITEEYVYSYVGKADASRFIQHLTEEEQQAKAILGEIAGSQKVIREMNDLVAAGRRSATAAVAPAVAPRKLTFRDLITVYGAIFRVIRQARKLRRQKRLLDMGQNPTLRIHLQMSWTMKMLLALLWIVIACTIGVDVLGLLGVGSYLALLGSLLLVVLTLAVFSLDKPLLRFPFFGHTVLSTVVFLAVPTVPLLVRTLLHF